MLDSLSGGVALTHAPAVAQDQLLDDQMAEFLAMVWDLHGRDMLPMLVFNFVRQGCESLAGAWHVLA